jgi:hypothetical protein
VLQQPFPEGGRIDPPTPHYVVPAWMTDPNGVVPGSAEEAAGAGAPPAGAADGASL